MGQTTAPIVIAAEQDALYLFPSERDLPTVPPTSAIRAAPGMLDAPSRSPVHRARRRSGVTICVARVSWGVGLGMAGVFLAGAIGMFFISRVATEGDARPLAPLLLSRQ